MKRILHITFLLSVLLLSCTKQAPAPKEDIVREGYTLLPANIETLLLDKEHARTWEESAAIGVFGSTQGQNEKYRLRSADAHLSRGEFYGPLVKGATIAAYYPFTPSFAGSAESLSGSLSGVQSFFADKDAPAQFLTYCPTAFAFLENGQLPFHYPCGLLKVTVGLDETLTVRSISLTDAVHPLAGPMSVTRSGAVLDSASGTNTLSLNCEAGIPTKDSSGNFQPFYLVMLAGDYADITLELRIDEEASPIVCQVKSLRIPRITTKDFQIGAITVQSGGPDSFEPVNVHFDE